MIAINHVSDHFHYLFSLSLSSQSFADDLEEARRALKNGNYNQAFTQGQAYGEIAGLLVAAEALNTQLLLGQSQRPKNDAKQAMAIARQILKVDPQNEKAKMAYALAYGFYGRSVSSLTAWRKKLPQKIHAAIDEAAAANLNSANSEALLAAWHLNIYFKAGEKMAKEQYGASLDVGKALFEKALDKAPQDILISANYAFTLYGGDRIVVKTREGEVMAKELKRMSADKVELSSLNAEYPGRSLELKDVQWIARIVWVSQ